MYNFGRKHLMVTLVMSLGLISCGGGGGGNGEPAPSQDTPTTTTQNPTPADTVPAITSFVASQNSITEGDSVSLTPIFPVGTGEIDNGVGIVVSGGTVTVTPTHTTIYTLTVSDGGGKSNTSTVSITVSPPAMPRLTDLISDIKNSIEGMDGVNIYPGATIFSSAGFSHEFDVHGFSYCMPGSPYADPVVSAANGKTTIYGCDNAITVSYDVVGTTKITIHVHAVNVYADVSGIVTKSSVTNSYLGYIAAGDYTSSYNVAVVDNMDGTYSLGAATVANIYTYSGTKTSFTAAASQIYDNNAAVATADISDAIYTMVDIVRWVTWDKLNTTTPTLRKFVF